MTTASASCEGLFGICRRCQSGLRTPEFPHSIGFGEVRPHCRRSTAGLLVRLSQTAPIKAASGSVRGPAWTEFGNSTTNRAPGGPSTVSVPSS